MAPLPLCRWRRDPLALGGDFDPKHQLDGVQMEEAYLGTLRAMELYTGKRDRATGALRLFLG
jgi:hypothetical protein